MEDKQKTRETPKPRTPLAAEVGNLANATAATEMPVRELKPGLLPKDVVLVRYVGVADVAFERLLNEQVTAGVPYACCSETAAALVEREPAEWVPFRDEDAKAIEKAIADAKAAAKGK